MTQATIAEPETRTTARTTGRTGRDQGQGVDLDDPALVFRMLGHAARLGVIRALRESETGELNVGELGTAVGQDRPVLSQHLVFLRAAGLVDFRRKGKHVYYRIAAGRIEAAVGTVMDRG